MSNPTAATVSAALRREGFNPVSPADHNREGVKVRNAAVDRVRVTVDFDNDTRAVSTAIDVYRSLRSLGYDAYVIGNTVTISREVAR